MVCVLFSGGLDSMVLAEKALQSKRLGCLLHVSYGQRASAQEYRAALRWAEANQAAFKRLILSVCGLEEMNKEPGKAGARVVPARNLILISHAVNYAAARGFKEVWFGACADDLEDYKDCRPDFVEALDRLTFSASKIRIRAPLIDSTKAEIVAMAKAYELDLGLTWSCYAPKNDAPCGKCNSCASRLEVSGG